MVTGLLYLLVGGVSGYRRGTEVPRGKNLADIAGLSDFHFWEI